MREVVRRAFFRGEISDDTLAVMDGRELEAGCMLLGIPKSGTVEEKRERISAAWALRQYLKNWSETSDARQVIAKAHTGKHLKELCQRWGLYAGGSKFAMVSAIIGWRNQCRLDGQAALKQASEDRDEFRQRHGTQLGLFLHAKSSTKDEQHDSGSVVPHSPFLASLPNLHIKGTE